MASTLDKDTNNGLVMPSPINRAEEDLVVDKTRDELKVDTALGKPVEDRVQGQLTVGTTQDEPSKNTTDADDVSPDDAHKALLMRLSRRWLTVEPVVIVYMTCYMSLLPMLQQYSHNRLLDKYNITQPRPNASTRDLCLDRLDANGSHHSDDENTFQKNVSHDNIILIVMEVVPTLIVIFFIVSLSNTRGRKWALVPQVSSMAVSGLLLIVVIHLHLDTRVIPFINFFVGLSGSMYVIYMAGFAYIADIMPPEKRFLHFLILEIGAGFGILVGQIVFGLLIDTVGYLVPAIVFTSVLALLLLYTVFALPETLTIKPEVKKCSCEALVAIPRLWFKDDLKGRRKVLWTSFFIILSTSMILESPYTITTLFLLDPPLCYSSILIGVYNGCNFMFKALGGLVLLLLLYRGVDVSALQAASIISCALLYLCLGLATETWVPMLGTILASGALSVLPLTCAMASNSVPKDQQGTLFAGLTFARILAMAIGSPVYSELYAITALHAQRYIFLGTLAASVVPLVIFGFSWLCLKRQSFIQDFATSTDVSVNKEESATNVNVIHAKSDTEMNHSSNQREDRLEYI